MTLHFHRASASLLQELQPYLDQRPTRRPFGLLVCASLLLLYSSALQLHAQNIDTFPLWNGTTYIDAWGGVSTHTYGQTFTATASQSILTSFTFAISNPTPGAAKPFQAYVYPWSGTTITGGPLFTGSNPTGTAGVNSAFVNYTANTGALALIPNQQYVAFFTTTTTLPAAQDPGANWAYLGVRPPAGNGVDGYTGGNFVFNNSTSFSGLTSGWENPTFFGGATVDDLAFRLTFVPEPTSLALLTSVCVVFSSVRRKRQ